MLITVRDRFLPRASQRARSSALRKSGKSTYNGNLRTLKLLDTVPEGSLQKHFWREEGRKRRAMSTHTNILTRNVNIIFKLYETAAID